MNRIKQLRKDKGLSQQALAEQIGLHYRTLQNWENGYGGISIGKAKKLAEYFGICKVFQTGHLIKRKKSTQKRNYTNKLVIA